MMQLVMPENSAKGCKLIYFYLIIELKEVIIF